MLQALRHQARAAWETLGSKKKAKLTIPGIDKPLVLTRKELASRVEPLLERIGALCQRVIEEAQVSPKKLQEVLLVGDASGHAVVAPVIHKISKRTKKGLPPADAVAIGAAFLGADPGFPVREVLTQGIGLVLPGGRFKVAVERNTPLPCEGTVKLTAQPQKDGLAVLEVDLYQGHGDRAVQNQYVASLEVPMTDPKPGDIHFRFRVDEHGGLAVDVAVGRKRPQTLPLVRKPQPAHAAPPPAPGAEDDEGEAGAELGNIYSRREL
jgi:molecular chaperone DnaK